MSNKIILTSFLLVPALVSFLTMKYTGDAIITMGALGIIYAGITVAYELFIDTISFTTKIGKEFIGKKAKIMLGLKLGAIGVVTGILGSLYCMYVSFGPQSIVLPFPIFDEEEKAKQATYISFFTMAYLIRVFAENVFYNIFIYSEFISKGGMTEGLASESIQALPTILVCTFQGLMQFGSFYFIFQGPLAAITITFFGIAVHYAVLHAKVKKGILVSTLLSLGFAIGVLIILLYFKYALEGKVQRKTPEFFFPGNTNNVWPIWFKSQPGEGGSAASGDAPAPSA